MTSAWWQAPEHRATLEAVLVRLNEARRLLEEHSHGAEVERRVGESLESLAEMERDLAGSTGVKPACVPRHPAALDAAVDRSLGKPSTKLAIYGSLAPGEMNHWVVAPLRGAWQEGFVRGNLRQVGWGAGYGFPALTWQADGERVAVKLLVAAGLRYQWQRIDAFEGEQYRRILVPVEGEGMTLAVANLYASRR